MIFPSCFYVPYKERKHYKWLCHSVYVIPRLLKSGAELEAANNRLLYSSFPSATVQGWGQRAEPAGTKPVRVSQLHCSLMLHVVLLCLTVSPVSLCVCSPCWSLSTGITSWRWASMALFSSASPLMSRERWVQVVWGHNFFKSVFDYSAFFHSSHILTYIWDTHRQAYGSGIQ